MHPLFGAKTQEGAGNGEKTSKGRIAWWGGSLASCRNIANLMVGSALQNMRRVEEAKTVRAVRNREDGTQMHGGSGHLEASAAMSVREWTLQQRTTEG